jgi:hypothetical protein
MEELFDWIMPPRLTITAAQPQQPPAPSESSQRRPQQRAAVRPLRSPPRKPRAPLKFRVFVHDEEFFVSTRSVEGATWGWVLSQVIQQTELKEQRAARQAAVKQRRLSWGGAPSPEMWAGLHLRQGDKLDLGDEVHGAFAHDSPLGPLYATISTAACSTSGKPSKAPDAPPRTAGGRQERVSTAAPDERALEREWVEAMQRRYVE